MSRRIGGLIHAAGLSSRMGDFKPLMPLRGKTLIENSIDSLLLCGIDPIVVVLGHRRQDMEAILKSRYLGDTLTLTCNDDFAATDMLASVKIGLAAMPENAPAIAFPTLEGYRKHPPLIDSRFIPDILRYEGQEGLRGFWKLHEDAIVTVPVDDVGCWTDLDTFAQYSRCVQRYRG